MNSKPATTFRLSPRCRNLIERLASDLGVPLTAVVELAIREKAERHGLEGGQRPPPSFAEAILGRGRGASP